MFTILGHYRNTLPNETTEIFDFWKFSMPYLGLEFILLYLLRVVLKHYNSIQTQIYANRTQTVYYVNLFNVMLIMQKRLKKKMEHL